MSQTLTAGPKVKVAPDEVIRRLSEMRHLSYERHAPTVVIYHDPHLLCPWPKCATPIRAIEFDFQQMGDEATVEHLRAAWWLGDGVVGPCPGCGQPVLFSIQFKAMANFPLPQASARMPDGWHRMAKIASMP